MVLEAKASRTVHCDHALCTVHCGHALCTVHCGHALCIDCHKSLLLLHCVEQRGSRLSKRVLQEAELVQTIRGQRKCFNSDSSEFHALSDHDTVIHTLQVCGYINQY